MRTQCDCGGCNAEFETETPYGGRSPQPAAGARAPRSLRLGGYLFRRRTGGGATEICHATPGNAGWPCAHEPTARRWTLRDETLIEFGIEIMVVGAILATLVGLSLTGLRSAAATHAWPARVAPPAATDSHGRTPVMVREPVVGSRAGDRQTPHPAPADGI